VNRQLNDLLEKARTGLASGDELRDLRRLIDNDTTGEIIDQVNAFHAQYLDAGDYASGYDLEYWHKVVNKILSADKISLPVKQDAKIIAISPVRRIRRTISWAAAIIICVSVGGYLLLHKRTMQQVAVEQPLKRADIEAPKINRATITLASGQHINLDSITSGQLVTIGNVQVTKLQDGKIVYNGTSPELIYNTLSNPRGSKVIDMTLADGSRVWLNAGSSVTYPVAFNGKERKVSMTGEAYFEIKHDASAPFKVSKGDVEVEVLGTHFNVNAYENEKTIRVTLLEGKVKVNRHSAASTLVPGQQAIVANTIDVENEVDMEEVMAWKNGLFKFKSMDVLAIINQLTNWYDVDISFRGGIPEKRVTGYIERTADISKVLEMLEYTAGIHYEIEGRKIILY